MRHDADTVGELVGLFKMLSTHDDRAINLYFLYEGPNLSARFNIKSRCRLVQDYQTRISN